MKSTLLLFATCVCGMLNAQITVTHWNVAGPGDMVTQSRDTVPSIASPTGGASQVWDYSTGLVAHEEDIMNFVAPGWLNNYGFFPTATLGATDANGFEMYLINDATSLRLLGMAADFFGTGDRQMYVNPADEMIRFPANYNDAYTTNSVQNMTILGSDLGLPADSIVNKTYTTKDVMIDAWGTMTTPYGSFDVLRLNEISYSTDSTWMYLFGVGQLMDNSGDTTYSYAFWSDDAGAQFPVMEMSHDNSGTVYEVSWLKEAPQANLIEDNIAQAKLFPNPASETVTIEFNTNSISSVNVYAANGTLVSKSNLETSTIEIDLTGLDDGMYYYNALDVFGNLISTDKFIVQK